MSTATTLSALGGQRGHFAGGGSVHHFPGAPLPKFASHTPASSSNEPVTVSDGLGVATLHRTVVEFANLDHGATAPALRSVANAVETALRTYGSVHRGSDYASRVTTQWYEDARNELSHFVGARDDDVVIFTKNTTDSLKLLAHAIPEDA